MHFAASLGLTDDQREFQRVALDFAKNELAPDMQKWDQEVCGKTVKYSYYLLKSKESICLLEEELISRTHFNVLTHWFVVSILGDISCGCFKETCRPGIWRLKYKHIIISITLTWPSLDV